MKGLVEETDTRTIYLTVKHHSICQDSKTEKPGFKPIEVKNPRTGETITKYTKPYKGIEALICKVELYDREHDSTRYFGWKIHMNAEGVPCVLDLPFDSRASNRFMKTAENLDFSQPIEFRAWYDAKSDATAFYIGQNGKSVPQFYTRDEPGDCPPPIQNQVTKKWNFDAQKEFLHGRMIEVVIPAVEEAGNEMPYEDQAMTASASAERTPLPDVPFSNEPELSDDDIPF
jgi:hypothetical protein